MWILIVNSPSQLVAILLYLSPNDCSAQMLYTANASATVCARGRSSQLFIIFISNIIVTTEKKIEALDDMFTHRIECMNRKCNIYYRCYNFFNFPFSLCEFNHTSERFMMRFLLKFDFWWGALQHLEVFRIQVNFLTKSNSWLLRLHKLIVLFHNRMTKTKENNSLEKQFF